jgi:hypothetical protein
MNLVQPTALLAAATCAALSCAPAFASDIRPSGYLERGSIQGTEGEPQFVPDSATNASGGRYCRVGGYDELVFYGVGTHPAIDWFWPSYRTQPQLKEILRASPGATSYLDRYDEAEEHAQNWARMGFLITVGAALAAAGGLAYSAIPTNPREMAPSFYYGTAGVAVLGLAFWGGSTLVAHDNQAWLDRAIDNYNRDMAGRRKTQQPTLVR